MLAGWPLVTGDFLLNPVQSSLSILGLPGHTVKLWAARPTHPHEIHTLAVLWYDGLVLQCFLISLIFFLGREDAIKHLVFGWSDVRVLVYPQWEFCCKQPWKKNIGRCDVEFDLAGEDLIITSILHVLFAHELETHVHDILVDWLEYAPCLAHELFLQGD